MMSNFRILLCTEQRNNKNSNLEVLSGTLKITRDKVCGLFVIEEMTRVFKCANVLITINAQLRTN